MLMLLAQGPHVEKQSFLPRKNVLGFPRCVGINEGADRDLHLAVIPRVAPGIKRVLSSFNMPNTMLDIEVNTVRETDQGIMLREVSRGQWS